MQYEVTSYNTKKMLADSLKRIMRKKKFSKVTISEIVEDCGVNRKTFYYHFTDVYDLLKWIFENEAVDVLKHYNLTRDYEETILFVMDYVEKNDYVINCAYDSLGRDEMKRFLYADFIEVVSRIIHTAEEGCSVYLDADYRTFLCEFYTEALAGILIDWIKHRAERNRQQVVQYLSETLKKSLQGILIPGEA